MTEEIPSDDSRPHPVAELSEGDAKNWLKYLFGGGTNAWEPLPGNDYRLVVAPPAGMKFGSQDVIIAHTLFEHYFNITFSLERGSAFPHYMQFTITSDELHAIKDMGLAQWGIGTLVDNAKPVYQRTAVTKPAPVTPAEKKSEPGIPRTSEQTIARIIGRSADNEVVHVRFGDRQPPESRVLRALFGEGETWEAKSIGEHYLHTKQIDLAKLGMNKEEFQEVWRRVARTMRLNSGAAFHAPDATTLIMRLPPVGFFTAQTKAKALLQPISQSASR